MAAGPRTPAERDADMADRVSASHRLLARLPGRRAASDQSLAASREHLRGVRLKRSAQPKP